MDSHLEVIDAFVDGERVATGALKSALSDAAGRDYFVDVWLLREAAQQDGDASVPRIPAVVPPQRHARQWLAAAALVVGVTGGYVAGNRAPHPASPRDAPATIAPPVVAVAPARAVFPAPPPTRVIQLEFQPDASRIGGD